MSSQKRISPGPLEDRTFAGFENSFLDGDSVGDSNRVYVG
jgi:hypothetical protein